LKHLTRILLLALLLCLCCTPAAQAEGAALTLSSSADVGYGGDEITISLALTAESLGGLQTTLTWNSGYLTYVEDSAAFSDIFTASAMTSMINDNVENRITLVYGNTSGYTAESEVIFTARFLLTEDVSGDTVFSLTGTKATDASSSLTSLDVETGTACVTTQIFDAGQVSMSIETSDGSPRLGSRITIMVNLASCSEAVGSLQGTLRYDPSILEYVAGSAAFSDEASSLAFTKMINDSKTGEIRYVYAAMNGFSGYQFITMEFDVIGGVNGWCELWLQDLKATNARTDRLALMNTDYWSCYLSPQGEPDTLYLTTWLYEGGYYVPYGSTVTLAIRADGLTFGGLQAVVNYNPDQLTYVPGSAAYSSAFRQGASVTMINDAATGQLKLVYANSNGYTPDNSDIFTAQFVINEIGYLGDPITLSGLKATNTGADLTSVPINGLNEIYWYVTPGEYDMSGVMWDYTEPFIYDGTVKTVQLVGLPDGLTPIYSGNTATEPGEYYATVTFEYDTEHYYAPYMSELWWTIVYGSYDMSGVMWDYATPFTYDGTEKTVQLVGLPDGLTPIYSGNTATEPGSYYASVYFESDSPYFNPPYVEPIWWDIYPGVYDMSGVQWNYTEPFRYDGTEKTVQLIGLPDGLIAHYSGNTATEPGEYYASVTFEYDASHFTEPEPVDGIWWKITGRCYDMSGVQWDYVTPFTYDGTEKTVQLTGLPVGVTPIYSGNTATEPGEYYATVTFEYDAENYLEPQMEGIAWQIDRATFDMSAVMWDYTGPFVYDGTEKTVQLIGLPVGVTPLYSGNTATEPGVYTATASFQYDEVHYNAPTVQPLDWEILGPPATGLRVTPSLLLLSTEYPWNLGYYTWEFLPEGSAEEPVCFIGDYGMLDSYENGFVMAHSAGSTMVDVETEDGRMGSSCEIIIVKAFHKAILPGSLTTIETEAFCGADALEVVILPDTVTSIGSRAFAESGLLYIQIPASVTSIADDAFDGSRLQMIYCPSGSFAVTYAAEHGIPWCEY